MWDFGFARTLAVVGGTWPFLLLRAVVYFAVTAAFVAATGVGAGIGYRIGVLVSDPSSLASAALWGAVAGFGLAALGLFMVREYILYVVTAGHVAVMVRLIDGHAVRRGEGQLGHARRIVAERFGEVGTLFVLDHIVKAVIDAITRIIGGVSAFAPLDEARRPARFANAVIRRALSHADEVVLGYVIRSGSAAPYETARRALVLYAQNVSTMIRHAVALAVVTWGLSFVVLVFMLAPAAAVLDAMPGDLAGWAFAFAILFAWAVKAALIEPFAIAALMQVYFRVIEDQAPDPEWDAKLTGASEHYRALKERAVSAPEGTASDPVRQEG